MQQRVENWVADVSPEQNAAMTSEPSQPTYALYGEIAAGGMASVSYGRRIGPPGFSCPVAVKRLHAQFASNPDFVSMFIDEARLSARLLHANIVTTLEVLEAPGELSLVMEYVHGEALGTLLDLLRARGETVPVRVASGLMVAVLHGLHAAHEATDELHRPLQVVHRDVSPQNILIGADGVPRIFDFGIARALSHMRVAPSGEIRGKLAYIAPEQLRGGKLDRRADVYGAAVVLWETLAARVLFDADTEPALVQCVLTAPIPAPSAVRSSVPRELDDIVLRGLARDPLHRYATALEMALELERVVPPATQSEIRGWLDRLAGESLRSRARALEQMQEDAEHARAEVVSVSPSIPETSSEVRMRTRRIAIGDVVTSLLVTAAAAAALSWFHWHEPDHPPRDVRLLRPAPGDTPRPATPSPPPAALRGLD